MVYHFQILSYFSGNCRNMPENGIVSTKMLIFTKLFFHQETFVFEETSANLRASNNVRIMPEFSLFLILTTMPSFFLEKL